MGSVAGDLDRALAETITLTVDDVLLPERHLGQAGPRSGDRAQLFQRRAHPDV